MSEKKQPSIIFLGIFLGVIGAISAGMLAGVAILTKEPIEKNQLKKTTNALMNVLPSFKNNPAEDTKVFTAENGTKVKFYIARNKEKDGDIVGIAGEGYSTKGFAGKVTVMLGLDLTGKITKVIVTKQSETPGLGTVVTDRKRGKTIFDLFGGAKKETGLPPNKILDGFDGHIANSDQWKVKKDGGNFDFITGATITSRAVTEAVYTVDSTFVANKDEILNPSAENKPSDK